MPRGPRNSNPEGLNEMGKRPGYVFANSTLAYVSAFFVTTFLHETGHFLAYVIAGAHPVLYHNYVQTAGEHLSVPARVAAAMAGPVISLLQGSVAWIFLRRMRRATAAGLLLLWLGLLGCVNAGGYLVLTPLSAVGDTGKAASLLGLGLPVKILAALAGAGILAWAVRGLGRRFAGFIPAGLDKPCREKYVYHVMFFPIIAGSAVQVAFAFPAPVFLSILYPATSSFVIMSSFGIILRTGGGGNGPGAIGTRIAWPLVLLTLAMIVLDRLLTLGVRWPG